MMVLSVWGSKMEKHEPVVQLHCGVISLTDCRSDPRSASVEARPVWNMLQTWLLVYWSVVLQAESSSRIADSTCVGDIVEEAYTTIHSSSSHSLRCTINRCREFSSRALLHKA